MASYNVQYCFWGLVLLSLSFYFSHSIPTSHVYVVYLGQNQFQDHILTSNSHVQLLTQVFASEDEAEESMVYSYKHSFSGFSAKLNSSQANALANRKEVISVFRSRILKLHTTRSWDFLGLHLDKSTDYITTSTHHLPPLHLMYGDDVVVGVLDTGIWPEAKSFKEERGMGPIPHWWRGECVEGEDFDPKKACNKKLIGARYYMKDHLAQQNEIENAINSAKEYKSPRDSLGHGTHTASTAVGSTVKNVSFLGMLGEGTARGGAPRARLAVYKVCWGPGGSCGEADILAAFDDAMRDGVNVISASFGGTPPLPPFFATSADIGSFHAMQRGVSVVFSAGNDGPNPSLVQNVSPWSISVAASSIDRAFPTQVLLRRLDAGGNLSITGESFITKSISGRMASAADYFDDGVCASEMWNKRSATGVIILCFSTIGPITQAGIAQEAVTTAKGSALIFVEPPTSQFPDVDDTIPTIRLDIATGTRIQFFLAQSRRKPMVQIFPSRTTIGKTTAPIVAPFSSRGPSSISPDILKPDITAPGINILAAWPGSGSGSGSDIDNWRFLSGTSMSCPHVSGVVALLKSAHPDWSPAAIRSAVITTASTRDTASDTILSAGTMKSSDPFDIGAGHINPCRAMDPGLVYDMKTSDYVLFLCDLGYTKQQILTLLLPNSLAPQDQSFVSCSTIRKTNANINYPSIAVSSLRSTTTIKRTVRHVGPKKSAFYTVSVVKPHGVEVTVWPPILIFSCLHQELSYFVTLTPLMSSSNAQSIRYDFGKIVWSDGFHKVRTPLAVSLTATNTPSSPQPT